MASSVSASVALNPPGSLPTSGFAPDGLSQHKLTRLLELRAVITSLRCDREARDPLLSWAIERERAGTR